MNNGSNDELPSLLDIYMKTYGTLSHIFLHHIAVAKNKQLHHYQMLVTSVVLDDLVNTKSSQLQEAKQEWFYFVLGWKTVTENQEA